MAAIEVVVAVVEKSGGVARVVGVVGVVGTVGAVGVEA